MSAELQKLKDDYQAIRAPAHMATRVLANVDDQRRRHAWLPGLAMAAIVLAVLGPLLLLQPRTDGDAKPTIPSLSQLVPTKPPVSVSSLGSLKSVSLPPMPAKPNPTHEKDTRSRIKNTTKEGEYS